VRIATWNVNNVVTRTERLVEFLTSVAPDVLCLQELKVPTDQFPYAEVEAAGYAVAARGDGRWNGVAILSRVGLEDPVFDLHAQPAWEGVVEPRAIAATCGGVRVWSLYIPNGRTVDDPHYAYKLEWLAALRDTAVTELARPEPLVILGDFNVAPTDADVWDNALFEKSTHVMRIDLVYASPSFAAAVTDAYVDRDARKPGKKGTPPPSDHAPVVVDVSL
jgi:exodeoxyribonuclease III